MLRCLDRDQRITLILGELFEIGSDEAAAILDISPAAFRKRLSRAKAVLVAFVSNRCGIVNLVSPCWCDKHIHNQVHFGMLDPAHLRFATTDDATSQQQYDLAQRQELNAVCRTSALLCAPPEYAPSGLVLDLVRLLIQNPNSRLFGDAGLGAV